MFIHYYLQTYCETFLMFYYLQSKIYTEFDIDLAVPYSFFAGRTSLHSLAGWANFRP